MSTKNDGEKRCAKHFFLYLFVVVFFSSFQVYSFTPYAVFVCISVEMSLALILRACVFAGKRNGEKSEWENNERSEKAKERKKEEERKKTNVNEVI